VPALAVGLALSLGYLCGAMPWGLWIGKVARGIDIREHGSRNLGATNVYRVLGPRLGLLTLLFDVSKGALPVWLVPALAAMDAFPGGRDWCVVTVGVAAVAGHVWTCFADFRGGKGVATTVGVLLAAAPGAFCVFVAVFAVVLLTTRYVSLASVLGSLGFVIALALATGASTPVFAMGAVLAALVVLRHRENLKRLARGEERRFSWKGGGTS
jgi:glycerol-3-phosphate acyltransferase PlsY